MQTTVNAEVPAPARADSKGLSWTGRLMTGLPLLFLTWDAAMKLAQVPQVVEASERIGFHRGALPVLAAIELLSIAMITMRRTRVLGAVLITAYLGGAVATHVRLGDPLFSHVLAPVYFAAVLWGGLFLLDARIRAISPFSR